VRLITRGPFTGLPRNYFRTLYLDPPWRFQTFTEDPGDRAPPYPTMTMDEIAALPLLDLVARDCWMQCWTSGPYLQHTMDIIRHAWGFRYSTVSFTWVKLKRDGEGFHKGLGMTTRKNTETVLLAKLGSPPIRARPDELLVTDADGDLVWDTQSITTPVREHSRKPDEVRDRIATMCDGPRLELFARQRAPGWHAWGNQTNRFAPLTETTAHATE
jgi:N6-adenosine-specific RNA methylase IME4